MRKYLFLGLAAVAGCATVPTAPQPEQIPVHGATEGKTCAAAGGKAFLGQKRSTETGNAILRATNAAVLRWAPPGMMMTMEYREDRATVRLGPDDRILDVSCN